MSFIENLSIATNFNFRRSDGKHLNLSMSRDKENKYLSLNTWESGLQVRASFILQDLDQIRSWVDWLVSNKFFLKEDSFLLDCLEYKTEPKEYYRNEIFHLNYKFEEYLSTPENNNNLVY